MTNTLLPLPAPLLMFLTILFSKSNSYPNKEVKISLSETNKPDNVLPFTFEDIVKQNENRIYYQMMKLGIHDPHREFYSEGLIAMWYAYQKYEPNKGPLATYFNFMIRNRLIDKIRKETRTSEVNQQFIQAKKIMLEDGNRHGLTKMPLIAPKELEVTDIYYWQKIRSHLTDKQWLWVQAYVIEGMTIKEIAEREGMSMEAVKSWGKEARKKLRERLVQM